MSKTIKKIAYSKYQLDWMMKHNLRLWDLILGIEKVQFVGDDVGDDFGLQNCEPNEEYEDCVSVLDMFCAWERDFGFDGMIWACFDEFLDVEYLNRHYMQRLLSSREFRLWLKDTGCNDTTKREMRGLKDGDVFIIDGVKHTADGDAHELEDDGEYVVYDENGASWFESDFMNW